MLGSNAAPRPRAMLPSLRVALNVGFVALGVALSFLSIPIGPAKVFPFQHMINVLVGVIVGPWDAALVALTIGVIRNGMGVGSVLAFPGGMFGGIVVGCLYRYVWRSDNVAFLESIGTVFIGGTLGYLLLLPVAEPTSFLGFMAAGPLAKQFLGFTGTFAIWVSFGVSSIPGSIIGFVVLKTLRATGLPLFEQRDPR